jgi:hypothetical protein
MALTIIAWTTLAIFVGGSWIGIPLLGRAYRPALATLCVAVIGGFLFSYLAGFSIGRFTALIPLLVTAFAVTHGRAARLQVAAQVAAILIYLLFAWLIAEQVHYWGIQFELPICLLAYALALSFPPAPPTRGSA